MQSVFQSTLPQGKWRRCVGHIPKIWLFQSTLPQGKWPTTDCTSWPDHVDFNPHFRKGSDSKRLKKRSTCQIFQSTLPQGKWQQYFTKISPHFYKIFPNIFEYTFAYYHNHLVYVKAHSNLFIFSGASLLVILCIFATRTCKLQE